MPTFSQPSSWSQGVDSNPTSPALKKDLESTLSQGDTNIPYRDINFSGDISDLLSTFESNSQGESTDLDTKTEATIDLEKYPVPRKTNGLINGVAGNQQTNKLQHPQAANEIGKPLVMKSSESFALTDALKEVILDLDVGKTVRNENE